MPIGVLPVASGGGGGGGASSLDVVQVNGYLEGQAVYFDGALWQLAKADVDTTLGIGILTNVTGAGFTVNFSGPLSGLPNPYPLEAAGPLVAGQYYFVSAATAGMLTVTEPANYSNPLLFALSATEAVVMPYRPSAVASGGAGGWTVAYEVDFAALGSTGAKLPDGAAVIDGKSWYVQGSANSTELQIVNGTGLAITTSGAGVGYNGNNLRNGPLITAKLTDLGAPPGGDWSEVRVSAIYGYTMPGADIWGGIALDNYLWTTGLNTAGPTQQVFGMLARYHWGTDGTYHACNFQARSLIQTVNPSTITGFVATDELIIHQRGFVRQEQYVANSVAGDFCPVADFIPVYSWGGGNDWGPVGGTPATGTSTAIVITATSGGYGHVARFWVKKLRIEYR